MRPVNLFTSPEAFKAVTRSKPPAAGRWHLERILGYREDIFFKAENSIALTRTSRRILDWVQRNFVWARITSTDCSIH
jgi:hypothetical protein